jgi:hypothetical protein
MARTRRARLAIVASEVKMMLMSVESTMSLWIGVAFVAAVVAGFAVYAWLTARHQRDAAMRMASTTAGHEPAEAAERRAA